MKNCDIQKKENKKNKIGINEIYTFFLVVSPILFIYGVGISSITLSDGILIVLNLLLFYKSLLYGKVSVFLNLLPFLFYIIILTFSYAVNFDALMRTVRYVFYLINVIFFAKAYFNSDFGIKVYRVVSLISTGYLFFQVLAYKLLGIYVPGVILRANLVSKDLYEYGTTFQLSQFKRFMSFFEEPSHFAIYILGYITILLFSKMKHEGVTKKNIVEFCFLSIGITLSTSILGVVVLGAMVTIWFATYLFTYKKSVTKFLFFICLFVVAAILVSKTSAFKYISNLSIVTKQGGGRFMGYSIIKDLNADMFAELFGRGMVGLGNGTFLASYPLLIYYFGYFGLILFILAFVPYFIKGRLNISNALLICLFGISLGSEILLGRFILVFLPFIIKGESGNISKNKKNLKNCLCNELKIQTCDGKIWE